MSYSKCSNWRRNLDVYLKFIYSEKATNFCAISTVDLSYVVTVKSRVEISPNFVAFSEYMNFKFEILCSENYYNIDHRLCRNCKGLKVSKANYGVPSSSKKDRNVKKMT